MLVDEGAFFFCATLLVLTSRGLAVLFSEEALCGEEGEGGSRGGGNDFGVAAKIGLYVKGTSSSREEADVDWRAHG